MINSFLMIAVAMLAAVALYGGRVLYRLHRECVGVERDPHANRGLLRWYSQGFEQPLRLAQWLLRINVVLVIVAVAAHAHPALIVAALCTSVLTYAELRFGGQRQRDHLRALTHCASDRTH